MKLLIYTRHLLIDRPLGPEDSALLLEGSWLSDSTGRGNHSRRAWRSLDEAIDGRLDWIDSVATDWSELLAGAASECVSGAYLNALALRYYLVKLLRLSAYFAEVQPLRAGDEVELVAAAPRDRDYADVLVQLCQGAGAQCRVRWIHGWPRRPGRFPGNPLWRRWAARLSGRSAAPPGDSDACRRVVLCGNPALLEPVCRRLLERGCRCWWLYDRFAVKSWWRWHAAGVGQLVCDSSLGRENRLPEAQTEFRLPEPLVCQGADFSGPVERWLVERARTHGRRQTRLIDQIDVHFRRLRPEALVLDEDATPLARAAVALARRHGARSSVVQHGVPCCRFGFAPPAADRILAWGRSSQQQLLDWGVPPERIAITGSPKKGTQLVSTEEKLAASPFSVLLLATVPPRDDRPDAVALHLTGSTYARMLCMAFAAVAGIGRAELIVKLHPRTCDDPAVLALQDEFPRLPTRVVRRGPLTKWLAGADCALSCLSSAGVEAAMAGVPVIQLAPPGASEFPPHDRWGLLGTARSESQLRSLLARVLQGRHQSGPSPDPNVFCAHGEAAAEKMAEEILEPGGSMPSVMAPEHAA